MYMGKLEEVENCLNNQERFLFSLKEKGSSDLFEADLLAYDCQNKKSYYPIHLPRFTYSSLKEFDDKIYQCVKKGIRNSLYLSDLQKSNLLEQLFAEPY